MYIHCTCICMAAWTTQHGQSYQCNCNYEEIDLLLLILLHWLHISRRWLFHTLLLCLCMSFLSLLVRLRLQQWWFLSFFLLLPLPPPSLPLFVLPLASLQHLPLCLCVTLEAHGNPLLLQLQPYENVCVHRQGKMRARNFFVKSNITHSLRSLHYTYSIHDNNVYTCILSQDVHNKLYTYMYIYMVCECVCAWVCSYCIPSGAQYFTYKGCLCQVREDTEQVTALKIKQEACS